MGSKGTNRVLSAMIIESQKINFVHIPKAAGSSVGRFINDNVELTKQDKEIQAEYEVFSKKQGYGFPNHTPASVKQRFLGEEEYPRYLTFTFVRNPYSLLVSLYEYTHQKEKKIFEKNGWKLSKFQNNILENSFDDWVLNYHTGRSQTDMLCSSSGEILVNYIGKTEYFHSDFGKLQKMLGFDCDLNHVSNSTSHDDYRKYYTDKSRRHVYSKYRNDFELFGYNFNNG